MAIIETNRVLIDEVTTEDAAFFYELLNSPNWIQFIGDRGINSQEIAADYIIDNLIKSYETNGFGLYKMSLKSNGKPIGICGFMKRNYLEHADIGFAILPEFEGQGFAQEGSQAVLIYGRNHMNFKTVFAITTSSNRRARKLLNNLGMIENGTIQPEGSQIEFILYKI